MKTVLALLLLVAGVLVAQPALAGYSQCIDARSQFAEVSSLADIPAPVRELLGANEGGPKGIANRGESFNETDFIIPTLPMRRFVLAGATESCVVVAIEQGGFAHFVRVILYERSEGRWYPWLDKIVRKPPTSLTELLNEAFENLLLGGAS